MTQINLDYSFAKKFTLLSFVTNKSTTAHTIHDVLQSKLSEATYKQLILYGIEKLFYQNKLPNIYSLLYDGINEMNSKPASNHSIANVPKQSQTQSQATHFYCHKVFEIKTLVTNIIKFCVMTEIFKLRQVNKQIFFDTYSVPIMSGLTIASLNKCKNVHNLNEFVNAETVDLCKWNKKHNMLFNQLKTFKCVRSLTIHNHVTDKTSNYGMIISEMLKSNHIWNNLQQLSFVSPYFIDHSEVSRHVFHMLSTSDNNFNKLQSLILKGVEINNMKNLKKFNLQQLQIEDCRICEDCFANMCHLQNLKSLQLIGNECVKCETKQIETTIKTVDFGIALRKITHLSIVGTRSRGNESSRNCISISIFTPLILESMAAANRCYNQLQRDKIHMTKSNNQAIKREKRPVYKYESLPLCSLNVQFHSDKWKNNLALNYCDFANIDILEIHFAPFSSNFNMGHQDKVQALKNIQKLVYNTDKISNLTSLTLVQDCDITMSEFFQFLNYGTHHSLINLSLILCKFLPAKTINYLGNDIEQLHTFMENNGNVNIVNKSKNGSDFNWAIDDYDVKCISQNFSPSSNLTSNIKERLNSCGKICENFHRDASLSIQSDRIDTDKFTNKIANIVSSVFVNDNQNANKDEDSLFFQVTV